MNVVEYFEIEGFWGEKKVSLNLHEDINFLIGTNGSGKTTIINLLSAVLQGDIPTLYSIQFSRAFARLKTRGANKKPIIEVTKTIDEKTNSFELKYLIKSKSGDKGASYVVEGPFEERIYHDPRYTRGRRLREDGARLGSILNQVVEVNWLSVHRTAHDNDRRRYPEEEIRPSVDTKIREISRGFSTYFSALSSQADKETESFQEHVFLSLLDQERNMASVFSATQEPADKNTVIGILKDLGVTQSRANRSVSSHLSRVSEARKKLEGKDTFTIDDAIALSDASRIGDMIIKWRQLQNAKDRIFEPKDKFEKIINSLFSGKELHFDERNLPKVHLGNRDEVEIGVLSSGEKQLFILLGEAVLQEEKPVVFISDEPELSLHVSWQSTLFQHIRSLNGACQIISATHSPDIVGHFKKNVIKVEDCFI